MSDLLMQKGAEFSECRRYRYRLWRTWDESKPVLVLAGLNPSDADEEDNDPTVTRVQVRAIDYGMGGLEVVNIYPLVSTDPAGLKVKDPDPWGPDFGVTNLNAIEAACRRARSTRGIILCGWGMHAGDRGRWIRERLAEKFTLHALKINSDGSPKHPLYCAYALKPSIWAPCAPPMEE